LTNFSNLNFPELLVSKVFVLKHIPMKKKVYVAFAIIVVIALSSAGYLALTTRNASPAATASGKYDNLDVSVAYCQPSKKGRLIFGTKQAGALQPWGQYWRAGANEATEIKFSRDVNFGGKEVKAGQYRFYAIPGESTWIIALNSELGKWGYSEANTDLDVVRVEVPAQRIDSEIEQFKIDFQSADTGLSMRLMWDKTLVEIPIK
jgi:hypothetical protein